jgi:uncharacterized protein (TIGR03435 family)
VFDCAQRAAPCVLFINAVGNILNPVPIKNRSLTTEMSPASVDTACPLPEPVQRRRTTIHVPTGRACAAMVLLSLISVRTAAEANVPALEVLAFDVASVKRNTSDDIDGDFGLVPGGRFVMINGSIRAILAMIYPDTPELIGLPEWISRERYDILAAAGREASRAEVVEMLRTLVVERFHFTAHVEPKWQATYALTLNRARGGPAPGLRPSSVNCTAIGAAAAEGNTVLAEQLRKGQPLACTLRVTPGRIESRGMNMDALAGTLRGPRGTCGHQRDWSDERL